MYSDHGCHGEVDLGTLPPEIQSRLEQLPGVWLEFESESGRILVRHAQPTSGPDLPLIAGELVQMLSQIPVELHEQIVGGAFYVHTLDTRQYVRLHVESGGVLQLQWARADFSSASKQKYQGRGDISLDPLYHRLNGSVRFRAADPAAAAAGLEDLADTYEGLYPEGEFSALGDVAPERVDFVMRDLNLDAHLLVERLVDVARPGTLEGCFTVSSFGEIEPENDLRIVFEHGAVFIQRPTLWPQDPAAA